MHSHSTSATWQKHFCEKKGFLMHPIRTKTIYALTPLATTIQLFQIASREVSLTILLSNIVRKCYRVFYIYPGPKNEQCPTQTF